MTFQHATITTKEQNTDPTLRRAIFLYVIHLWNVKLKIIYTQYKYIVYCIKNIIMYSVYIILCFTFCAVMGHFFSILDKDNISTDRRHCGRREIKFPKVISVVKYFNLYLTFQFFFFISLSLTRQSTHTRIISCILITFALLGHWSINMKKKIRQGKNEMNIFVTCA